MGHRFPLIVHDDDMESGSSGSPEDNSIFDLADRVPRGDSFLRPRRMGRSCGLRCLLCPCEYSGHYRHLSEPRDNAERVSSPIEE